MRFVESVHREGVTLWDRYVFCAQNMSDSHLFSSTLHSYRSDGPESVRSSLLAVTDVWLGFDMDLEMKVYWNSWINWMSGRQLGLIMPTDVQNLFQSLYQMIVWLTFGVRPQM